MKSLLGAASALYKRYPSRINGAVASGICAIALAVGVGLDQHIVLSVVAILLPIAAAEVTHRRVTPVAPKA